MLIKIDFKAKEHKRKIKEIKNSNKLIQKDIKDLHTQFVELKSLVTTKLKQEEELNNLSNDNKELTESLDLLKEEIEKTVTILS